MGGWLLEIQSETFPTIDLSIWEKLFRKFNLVPLSLIESTKERTRKTCKSYDQPMDKEYIRGEARITIFNSTPCMMGGFLIHMVTLPISFFSQLATIMGVSTKIQRVVYCDHLISIIHFSAKLVKIAYLWRSSVPKQLDWF